MLEGSREAREREMADGYRDGWADGRAELPEGLIKRGEAYCFGWMNGRDDRKGVARAPAETLREEAERILRGEPPTRRRVGAAVAAALVLGRNYEHQEGL